MNSTIFRFTIIKHVIFSILFLLLVGSIAYGGETLWSVNFNWQLGIRIGYDHNFNNKFGIKADAGIGIPGILMADVFLTIKMPSKNQIWHFALSPGIPNILMPIGSMAFMVSPGVSFLARREISERLNIDFRVGEGFPLFFEKGKDIIRNVGFPFGLWPDFNLGVSFKY